MIVYLDTSALVKRYIEEDGTIEVNSLIDEADYSVTNLISRAEVPAAIMRASRMNMISRDEAQEAIGRFRSEWESLQRLPVTGATVEEADNLVGNHDLRGYDAVHLAAAKIWQEAIGELILFATFDQKLRDAALNEALEAWPENS
jgi:predicted nucleic acid-binding protein